MLKDINSEFLRMEVSMTWFSRLMDFSVKGFSMTVAG